VSAASQQRELVLAAAEVVGKTQSTLFLADSMSSVNNMLGAQMVAQQALAARR